MHSFSLSLHFIGFFEICDDEICSGKPEMGFTPRIPSIGITGNRFLGCDDVKKKGPLRRE
jgi:hypothetical protein